MTAQTTAAAIAADASAPPAPAASAGWAAAIDALGVHLEQTRWTMALARAIARAVPDHPDDAIALAGVLLHVHGMQAPCVEIELHEARSALEALSA